MELSISLPLFLIILCASSIFTLFIFSFLIASKAGDEKINEILEKTDFENNEMIHSEPVK